MPELLLRPSLERRAHRLKCRFPIDAAPIHPYKRAIWERELEKAKRKWAEWFIEEMRKEGWAYLDRYGFRMRGPFPQTVTSAPVKRPPWHIPTRDLIAAVRAGYRLPPPPDDGAVRSMPLLTETERWEFELTAMFSREALRIEIPDPHEEKEENSKP